MIIKLSLCGSFGRGKLKNMKQVWGRYADLFKRFVHLEISPN